MLVLTRFAVNVIMRLKIKLCYGKEKCFESFKDAMCNGHV